MRRKLTTHFHLVPGRRALCPPLPHSRLHSVKLKYSGNNDVPMFINVNSRLFLHRDTSCGVTGSTCIKVSSGASHVYIDVRITFSESECSLFFRHFRKTAKIFYQPHVYLSVRMEQLGSHLTNLIMNLI